MIETRSKVLCVDDEPKVLESLQLSLRRKYSVATATSGTEGLQIIEREGPFAVVLSDMRMPGMDGATFLSYVRNISPNTVRLLLTGQTGTAAAAAAINEGQIFRFLTKPCPPNRILEAIQAAVDQHNLITAEKVLLEQTLRGSIQALVDVLALSNPQVYGRATCIKQYVRDMALKIGLHELWTIEVAAMLFHIGYVILTTEIVEKLHTGQELTAAEQGKIAQLPEITNQLLEDIPRLEQVRSIIRNQARPRARSSVLKNDDVVSVGSEALRVALAFDHLERSGLKDEMALSVMRGRDGVYEPLLLDAFSSLKSTNSRLEQVRELQVNAIKVGMVLAEDVRMQNGALLAARGYEITQGFVERIRSFRPDAVKEPLRVIIASLKVEKTGA